MAARNPGNEDFARPFVFLAVFFRVTHDGLSERGTTRSLKCKVRDKTLGCESVGPKKKVNTLIFCQRNGYSGLC